MPRAPKCLTVAFDCPIYLREIACGEPAWACGMADALIRIGAYATDYDGESAMCGFITTRDLFFHSTDIVREFGVACYLRCLRRSFLSARKVTFLECTCTLAR
jgi:hypothetical protein